MKLAGRLLIVAFVSVWLTSEAKRSLQTSVTAIPGALDRPMSQGAGKNKKEKALDCGRHLVKPGTSVTFKSKSYPDGYQKGKCTWSFRTKKGAALAMRCSDFMLEETPKCKKDFMQINDYSGEKKKYCGLQKSLGTAKSSSRLQVKFKASKNRSYKGFSCTVESKAPLNCGLHYVAPGTSLGFQSENYPEDYPGRTQCTWSFATDEGATLAIFCDDFSVQNSRSCRRDFFQVTDFASFNDRYCGTSDELIISGQSSALEVFFKTNKRKSSRGFCCAVTASDVSVPQTPAPSPTSAPGGCSCGRVNRFSRIVGGSETEVNEYPWMAGLIANRNFICGGAVVADEWVLTAAHCAVYMDTSDAVLLGDHDYFHRALGKRNIPPYGISQITWPSDNTVAPVCLPSAGESYGDVRATVTGWGAQSESGRYLPQLYEVTVTTLTNAACNSLYDGGILDGMICAGDEGKDSCQGDSGGPMIYDESGRYVEIGIVSWGSGALGPQYPGVYTRVNKETQHPTSQATSSPPQINPHLSAFASPRYFLLSPRLSIDSTPTSARPALPADWAASLSGSTPPLPAPHPPDLRPCSRDPSAGFPHPLVMN
ncbi:Transmembrane protease serine 9 [Penaeus vannamei]|uniref:Transmembrane protease serine 9 n=1 Tax=Penaeus vannamei TaxID=6689 RepID=A0A3R7MV39_PENVA|nr:Transmembrane protease serine 9 [Penaeus vannamei]